MNRVFAVIAAAYALLYLAWASASEVQPDGVSYHYGLAAGRLRADSFYAMLPHGVEWLLPAPLLSFASLAFVGGTVWLLFRIARRLELPEWSAPAASVLYACAPITGVCATSSYTDTALVFFAVAAFAATLEDRAAIAGVLAGCCYAVKISGAIVPLAVVLWFLSRRRWTVLAAVLPIAPWMIRAYLATGNPVAPLASSLIPNPGFHAAAERLLSANWAARSWTAPWDLVYTGKLQGIFGLACLLLPLGLFTRRPLAIAAAIAAMPWIANAGARFLMPAVPLAALGLAARLPRPAAVALMAAHAVLSWPHVLDLYLPPHVWRLQASIPSLRDSADWQVADMMTESAPPGARVFALLDVAHAYTVVDALSYWHNAEADRVLDTLRVVSALTHDTLYEESAPAAGLQTGIRIRVAEPGPGEWDIHEIALSLDGLRLHASPAWTLRAWPNPWELDLVFDNNPATRWRTWEPIRAGMNVEAVFDRPQRIDRVAITTHAQLALEFYVRGIDGQWRRTPSHRTALPRADDRRSAMRYLGRLGYTHLVLPIEQTGAWTLGREIAAEPAAWGIIEKNARGYARFYELVKQ